MVDTFILRCLQHGLCRRIDLMSFVNYSSYTQSLSLSLSHSPSVGAEAPTYYHLPHYHYYDEYIIFGDRNTLMNKRKD